MARGRDRVPLHLHSPRGEGRLRITHQYGGVPLRDQFSVDLRRHGGRPGREVHQRLRRRVPPQHVRRSTEPRGDPVGDLLALACRLAQHLVVRQVRQLNEQLHALLLPEFAEATAPVLRRVGGRQQRPQRREPLRDGVPVGRDEPVAVDRVCDTVRSDLLQHRVHLPPLAVHIDAASDAPAAVQVPGRVEVRLTARRVGEQRPVA